MISAIVEIGPTFSHIHFVKKFSCQLIIMVGQIEVAQVHISLSQTVIDREFRMFGQSQRIAEKQGAAVIRGSVRQVTAMQAGVSHIDTNVGKKVQALSFQTICIRLLIIKYGRIGTVQLHPNVSFNIINIGQDIVPARTLGNIAGELLNLSIVIKYRVKIRRNKEGFTIKGEQTIIHL